MRLDTRGFALSCAILWSAALLLMALLNLIWGGYGKDFLDVVGSFYPGYHAGRSVGQVVLVTVYGFADGLIGGAVLCALYNRLAKAG
ncbi:MAG: hypothetical protein WBD67_09210 [Terracidiphilus sp.]